MPVEFRGNTGAPIQQLFIANGMAIEIDCSSSNLARVRSTAEDGFAKSVFTENLQTTNNAHGDRDRTIEGAADGFAKSDLSSQDMAAVPGDGVIEGPNVDDLPTGMRYSLDTDFDFNNLIVLTIVGSSNTGAPGIYEGTFAHTTNFALSNVVTGVYGVSINTNTSAGNCVFVGTTQRD